MLVGKASKHSKNRCFLVTDTIVQEELIVQHRGTELIWSNANPKPSQGDGFRLFRSMLMCIPPDHDNDIERTNTHPFLLPKAKAVGVISKQDIDALKCAMWSIDDQEHKKSVKSKLISPPVKTVAKQRSVLDDNRYGPGNRPHWAISRIRFPNLIKALNMEPDINTRKQVFSLYHGLIT